jgi:hypothetical protein
VMVLAERIKHRLGVDPSLLVPGAIIRWFLADGESVLRLILI